MGTFEYACVPFGDGLYRDDIMHNMADLFDIGVNTCKFEGAAIVEAFVVSGLAEQFERHNPVYVAGKSGSELLELLLPYLGEIAPAVTSVRFGRTPDYWLGWNVAFFQMKTGCTYKSIFQREAYDELLALYSPLHEADESKFVEVLKSRLRQSEMDTGLKRQRIASGLSQSELAEKSKVGIRSIQMYEQRNKDINKAQAVTLLRLSQALHCSLENLLER